MTGSHASPLLMMMVSESVWNAIMTARALINHSTHNIIHIVVGINFSIMDVIVNENNGTVTMCLMKNVTTDGPITVVFDAEEESGVSNPASGQYCTHTYSV